MKKLFEILSAALFLAVTVTWAAALILAGPALLKLCILYLFGYTKARQEASDLSYLVAILRNHLIFWKKHSTRWRSLYRCQSTGQGSETLLCGGIT